MDLKKLIKEYYFANQYMQLATSVNGQPWVCTVYYANDENFNLYWTSGRSRQHSLEIKQNDKVSVTIVKDSERKQALQIIGNAYEVNDSELEATHEIYTSKFGPKPDYLENIQAHHPDGRAYWVLKPTKISLWDEVNFPDNPKQEYLVS